MNKTLSNSLYMRIENHQNNISVLETEELKDHPYSKYILWREVNNINHPDLYSINELYNWINVNPVNPFTRERLENHIIERIICYKNIYDNYVDKKSYIEEAKKIELDISYDLTYDEIFKIIFNKIYNLLKNGMKLNELPFNKNFLRSVFKIEYLKEKFDIYKNQYYQEETDRSVGKKILQNRNKKLVRSSSLVGNENNITFTLCDFNKNNALGYKNGIGIVNYSPKSPNESILPGMEIKDHNYDFLFNFFYDFFEFYFNELILF